MSEDPNDLFDYCQETGVLTHKLRGPHQFPSSKRISAETRCLQWNNCYASKRAGWVNNMGYSCVVFGGKTYLAHRVIWRMIYGEWPDFHLDHVNGNKTDNRLSNLRASSPKHNAKNMKIRADNTSGVGNISWHKQRKKWCVRMRNEVGVYKHYGLFEDIEEAIKVRNAIASSNGYSERHGLSA